jgi:hypothetical protein
MFWWKKQVKMWPEWKVERAIDDNILGGKDRE